MKIIITENVKARSTIQKKTNLHKIREHSETAKNVNEIREDRESYIVRKQAKNYKMWGKETMDGWHRKYSNSCAQEDDTKMWTNNNTSLKLSIKKIKKQKKTGI